MNLLRRKSVTDHRVALQGAAPAGGSRQNRRRDADQLARLLRGGELTGIYGPDPQDEAVRDLIRSRYQVQKQQHRARQQLKMFLLRQKFRYAGSGRGRPNICVSWRR